MDARKIPFNYGKVIDKSAFFPKKQNSFCILHNLLYLCTSKYSSPCRRLQQPFSGCLLRRRLRRARQRRRHPHAQAEARPTAPAPLSEESPSRSPHPRPPRPPQRPQGLPLLRCKVGVFEPVTLGAASPSEASPLNVTLGE